MITLTLLFFIALYVCYRIGFYYRDKRDDPHEHALTDQVAKIKENFDRAIDLFEEVPFEEVQITTFDGLKLSARYYHVKDGAPLQIQMHGYKGNAIRDFAGVWPIAQQLQHNVLLVDERCHRHSQGRTITYGIKEHRDCLEWIKYACNRFGDVQILLMGVSMGAATVLMASAEDLPHNVKGVIADCPFDSPENIIRKVVREEMRVSDKFFYPLIRAGARVFGNFDLHKNSPLKALPNAKVPVLIIHGNDDQLVPYEMSCNLKNVAPDKVTLVTIENSGHAMNQIWDPQTYRNAVIDFVSKNLKEQ